MAEAPSDKLDKQDIKNTDDVALELMKFIAVTTGYGKGTPTAGFGGKGQRSSEEFADALLELFERCRAVVKKAK
jgi:ATP:corrinoid adenosyltransferase